MKTSNFQTHEIISRRGQQGSAVIIMITLLAVVFIYVGGNARTLNHLNQELKLLERQQTRRLQACDTNSAVAPQPQPAPRQGE